jgi:hypothetical protein
MNRAKVRDDVEKAVALLIASLAVLRVLPAPKKKKGRVIRGIGMRPRRVRGGHKTARMMVILADGKKHTAKELALAGNTTTGHVHTHLAGRLKKGLVKRPAAGIFQLAAKKKAA